MNFNLLIFIFNIFIFSSTVFASDVHQHGELGDTLQKTQSTKKFITISLPANFTAELVSAFKAKQPFVTDIGQLYLDQENYKKFRDTTPYKFQIFTGTNLKFGSHISLVPGSEHCVNNHTIRATYQFNSPYSHCYDAQFDVLLTNENVKFINLADSILGDRDFLWTNKSVPSNASYYYLGMVDEDFLRQTNHTQRLNCNIQNYLLIKEQLINGTDVFGITQEERKILAENLFKTYLEQHNLTLKDGKLTMDEYVEHILALKDELLKYKGLTTSDLPAEQLLSGEIMEKVHQKLKCLIGIPSAQSTAAL